MPRRHFRDGTIRPMYRAKKKREEAMADRLCQYGNCSLWVAAGQGVNVAAAGYRVKFCGWKHAALWVLEKGKRLAPEGSDAELMRQAERLLEGEK